MPNRICVKEAFCATLFQAARKSLILNGEMSEWLKEHAWKACVGETLPRVRIPLSPPSHSCVFCLPGEAIAFRPMLDVPHDSAR